MNYQHVIHKYAIACQNMQCKSYRKIRLLPLYLNSKIGRIVSFGGAISPKKPPYKGIFSPLQPKNKKKLSNEPFFSQNEIETN